MKRILITLGIFVLLILSTTVFAQTNNTEPVSCFDYYKFGSVYASLETKNYKNTSGTTINFFGEVKNDNKYPIVDGKLFVKIMRQNDSYEKTGGQDEVDSFIVKEGISIPANSSLPINFDWKIPAHSISGEYQVSTYFLVDNSFNMSGLSFTTDIVGGVAKFNVIGEQKEGLIFDRTKITLNDEPYYTVAFTPSVSATSTADISFTLKNETNQTQQVPVTIQLYEWDGQAQKNLLDTKEVKYLMEANKTITIPYTVTDTKHSVYYVLAQAQYKDAKSEVSVRFSRQGIQEPRINFSTFTQYPFVKGEENSLITCVHNTNNGNAEYGKVITSVLDHNGNTIHTSTYEGKITGAIQGMLSKFTPGANYKDLKIETKIYNKENNIIDQSSVDYVCSSLSDDCKEPNTFFNFTTLIATLAVLILLALLITFRHRLKKKDLIVMFMFVLLAGVLFVPRVGEAKMIEWIDAGPDGSTLYKDAWMFTNEFKDNWPSDMYWDSFGQAGVPSMSVKYFATLFNSTKGTNLNDTGGNICVVSGGDLLRFTFTKHDWSHIYWYTSGYSYDTPYGDWVNNAGTTLVGGQWSKYGVEGGDNGIYYTGVYGQLSVNPPVKQLVNTANLNCGTLQNGTDGSYVDCTVNTVTATTTINPKFNFAATIAKFYMLMDSTDGSAVGNPDYYVARTYTDVNLNPNNNQIKIWNIPSQEIGFTCTISPTTCNSSNTPNKPTITPPASVYVNTPATFSFSPSNATTTYEIDWGAGAGWESTTNPVTKPWTATGTKSIKVRASNSASLCSSQSDPASVTVLDSPTLNPISNLSAVGSCGSVSLSWTGNGANSYQVYRNNILIGSVSSSSYVDSSVTNGTSYTYKIVAMKSGYTDVTSNSSNATPGCLSCNGTYTEGQVLNSGGICTRYNCNTSTGIWLSGTVACPAIPIITDFYFNPNTVSSGNSCPLYLKTQNVSSCKLTNRLGNDSWGPFTATNQKIEINDESVKIPIGTHTLQCKATSTDVTYTKYTTQKCFSDSNIKEN